MEAKEGEKLKEIEFIISDLHLSEQHSVYESFCDDDVFKHFIKMLIKKHAGRNFKVTLAFNGDTFDVVAVLYKGYSVSVPYERVDFYKMEKIIEAHRYFFRALKNFLSFENFHVKFVVGNHDLCLHWPSIKKLLLKELGERHAPKIEFVGEILKDGIYVSHGNTEHHTKSPANPVVGKVMLVPFKKGSFEKMLKGEIFTVNEVLDIPLGHYLMSVLENPLKKHNLLIGHMRRHGFVWLNAIFGIGRKTWYRRSRWFAAIAAILTFWVMLEYWWYTRDLSIFKKILQVLWWTITGVLEGQMPRDKANRLLERDDISAVIFGHEHVPCYETIRVGNRSKLYINVGTWQLMRAVKVEPIDLKWKHFKKLERLLKRIRRWWSKLFSPVIEDITEFPVVRILRKENGECAVKLMRFGYSRAEEWRLEEFI